MKYIWILFIPVLLQAQTEIPKSPAEKPLPKYVVKAGFCLPELYNLGYELDGTYFPYSKPYVRFGPSLQLNNFYIVNKNWFNSNNQETSTSAEVRVNLHFQVEVIPVKKSTFYIGVSPYIGYQHLSNRGRLTNPANELNISWKYAINTFDYGSRYSLGGYLGKKKQYGLETAFQLSNRGISDQNPLTKFLEFANPTYKLYIAFNFVYRIK